MFGNIRNFLKYFDKILGYYFFGCFVGLLPFLRGRAGLARLRDANIDIYKKFMNEKVFTCQTKLSDEQVSIFRDLLDQGIFTRKSDFTQWIEFEKTDFQSLLLSKEMVKKIVDELSDEIGVEFKLESTTVWRNLYTDDPKAYSADWHFDRRPTNWVRFFIILNSLNDRTDGPFTFQRNTRLYPKVYNRDKLSKIATLLDSDSEILIGEPGLITAVNTQYLLHRAGIPQNGKSRDMLEIVLSA